MQIAQRIGIASAATYLVIDLIYVAKREIPKTYLLDAAMEVAWLRAWIRRGERRSTYPGCGLKTNPSA